MLCCPGDEGILHEADQSRTTQKPWREATNPFLPFGLNLAWPKATLPLQQQEGLTVSNDSPSRLVPRFASCGRGSVAASSITVTGHCIAEPFGQAWQNTRNRRLCPSSVWMPPNQARSLSFATCGPAETKSRPERSWGRQASRFEIKRR